MAVLPSMLNAWLHWAQINGRVQIAIFASQTGISRLIVSQTLSMLLPNQIRKTVVVRTCHVWMDGDASHSQLAIPGILH